MARPARFRSCAAAIGRLGKSAYDAQAREQRGAGYGRVRRRGLRRAAAKPPVHAIGQPIDDLSAPELAERIALLKLEIERLERAIAHREATRNAAAAFFKS